TSETDYRDAATRGFARGALIQALPSQSLGSRRHGLLLGFRFLLPERQILRRHLLPKRLVVDPAAADGVEQTLRGRNDQLGGQRHALGLGLVGKGGVRLRRLLRQLGRTIERGAGFIDLAVPEQAVRLPAVQGREALPLPFRRRRILL